MNRAVPTFGQSSFQGQPPTSPVPRPHRLSLVRDEPLGESQGLEPMVSTVADRVAALIRQDKLREAHAVLRGARSAGLGGSRLELIEKLFEVVARPGGSAPQGSPAGRFESTRYRGRWVALMGTTVVDAAPTLSELELRVKGNDAIVLHWVAP